MNSESTFQRRAKWLGYLGIIPFLAVSLLLTDLPEDILIDAIQYYAAIILTFVGAIHWGRGLNTMTDKASTYLLTISVIPSLIAWLSLLVPDFEGLIIVIIAFLILLAFDFKQYATQPWFRTLRMQLTLIACTCLAFCLFISMQVNNS
ncbi:MAG: DUF3429 domain-containing protein [Gammaproteobacteria bacterium]|nr:DUF3429 domain-containing protein [Gammaproteobacteria bacterium]